MHGGIGGAVSEDDDGIGEPDGETGGDEGVGCVGQVICIYPYVPLASVFTTEYPVNLMFQFCLSRLLPF